MVLQPALQTVEFNPIVGTPMLCIGSLVSEGNIEGVIMSSSMPATHLGVTLGSLLNSKTVGKSVTSSIVLVGMPMCCTGSVLPNN